MAFLIIIGIIYVFVGFMFGTNDYKINPDNKAKPTWIRVKDALILGMVWPLLVFVLISIIYKKFKS